MVAFTSTPAFLAVALLAALPSVTAYGMDIRFSRFLSADCSGAYIGAKDKLHSHNKNCKTWASGTPFHTYTFVPSHDADAKDKYASCKVSVWSEPHCQGDSVTMGQALDVFGMCGVVPFPEGGRSVSVTCDGKAPKDNDEWW